MDGYIASMAINKTCQSQEPEKCSLLQVLKRSIESCRESHVQKQSQYKVTIVGSAVGSNPDILGVLCK